MFGFDLSENMIEIARNKNREYKIPGVSLINTYLLFRYIFHNLRSIVKKIKEEIKFQWIFKTSEKIRLKYF